MLRVTMPCGECDAWWLFAEEHGFKSQNEFTGWIDDREAIIRAIDAKSIWLTRDADAIITLLHSTWEPSGIFYGHLAAPERKEAEK